MRKYNFIMRAIQKVTSSELLLEQSMKKNVYTKSTYTLKQLLNIVTTRIEALMISGNKFCMPVSKKSAACELSHVLRATINLNIDEAL
jgi:uncharacterized protein YbcV (DUF1398 family)